MIASFVTLLAASYAKLIGEGKARAAAVDGDPRRRALAAKKMEVTEKDPHSA